ncbi:MAG: serine protease [Clostridiaceae bacterium]|nr:serine protease [Clostridiaceae bacterium]
MRSLDNLKNIIDSNFEGMDLSDIAKKSIKEKTVQKRSIQKRIIRTTATFSSVFAVLVACILVINSFWGTVVTNAQDLMEGIKPGDIKSLDKQKEEALITPVADFSVRLLKETLVSDKNVLISPASIYLGLGMTANGANGTTLEEFENVLGMGANISDLNVFYKNLTDRLTNHKGGNVTVANSIWYRSTDELNVKNDFLQKNADYYGASAYKANFDDPSTVDVINNWVRKKTNGSVDKIINEIHPNSQMFLINTLYFEGKWLKDFTTSKREGIFHTSNGDVKTSFMYSSESFYINNKYAQGFIKPYKGDQLSFVGILPEEGISAEKYIEGLTGESFLEFLNSREHTSVGVFLPKFETEYEISLNDSLNKLGLVEAFHDADFSNMADNPTRLYIENVFHKVYIQVSERGTRAGAVSKVENVKRSSPSIDLTFNRPFIYAIIDNETNLPLFMGIIQNPKN